jgi:4-hydroxyphenylpyruvate dioxygenase
MNGIEFIEFATSRPQALGQALESMGFRPLARHRSREVTLYRQGEMNLVVNAHPDDARVSATVGGNPVISAVAFRVRDALKAHASCIELGAWAVPSQAQAMELHIPAIHGPGGSRYYFVDRWEEFSIYDIDFLPIPTVDPAPPALANMQFFGVVQYIAGGRSADWMAYYEHLFGFSEIPDQERFGILPKGKLMRSACGRFLWQLVEPDPGMDEEAAPERLQRLGFGVGDVGQAVSILKARGVEFVESAFLHPEDRGALTRTVLGTVSFELVHQTR